MGMSAGGLGAGAGSEQQPVHPHAERPLGRGRRRRALQVLVGLDRMTNIWVLPVTGRHFYSLQPIHARFFALHACTAQGRPFHTSPL